MTYNACRRDGNATFSTATFSKILKHRINKSLNSLVHSLLRAGNKAVKPRDMAAATAATSVVRLADEGTTLMRGFVVVSLPVS